MDHAREGEPEDSVVVRFLKSRSVTVMSALVGHAALDVEGLHSRQASTEGFSICLLHPK